MDGSAGDSTDIARKVLRSAATAALATLGEGGAPFVTLATVATDQSGAALCLLSRLAAHTTNLAADGRASLLLGVPGEGDANPLSGARLTLVGRMRRLADDDPALPLARERFLARHPEAAVYASFTDFAIHRLDADHGHLVAGFGRVSRVPGGRLLVDEATAAAFGAAGPTLIAGLNGGDTDLGGLARAHLRRSGSGWRVVAVDADGLDLAVDLKGSEWLTRLPFRRRLGAPEDVGGELLAMLGEIGDGRPAQP